MKESNYTTARYLGPTATKGSRIKIQHYRNGWKAPIFLPYCYETGNVKTQVIKYLKDNNLNPIKLIDHKLTYIFITE